MAHGHGHRFPFEKAHKLDSDDRRKLQPPEPAVEALGLQQGNVVIDLGVGTGYFALPIAAKLRELGEPRGRVLALDIEPRMLELVAERARQAGLAEWLACSRVPEGSPSHMPVETRRADRALLVNIYHELPNRPATLAELRRVLRGGGRVLIVDWDPAGTTESGPPREHRVPAEEIERDLRDAGFLQVERLPLYEHHTVIRGQTPLDTP